MILAAVLVLAMSNSYSYMIGSKHEDARWTAKITAERLAATEKARAIESKMQEATNAAINYQQGQVATVRRNLNIALNSLRNRPERPANVPDHPRSDCEGANGPELAGEHARFLARYAALAAEQDVSLAACYTYADTVIRK